MKLKDLLSGLEPRAIHGDPDAEVTAVTADSRLVTKGAVFVAIAGFQTDGAKFVASAVEKGAAAVVRWRAAAPSGPNVVRPEGAAEGSGPPPVVVLVDDPRAALATIAANFYGRPAGRLTLVGVTGTSGKTTTTKMLESIFDATGEPVGLIGTIEYRAGDERLTADRTTPDAVVLQEWFAKMAANGVTRAVMEVSSHALALKRTHGVKFAAAVFTNLSRDHFDFHKDFDDYFAAKKILFTQVAAGKTSVVNIDDEYGAKLAKEVEGFTFGMSAPADIHPSDQFEVSVNGLRGILHTPIGDIRVASQLLGQPNLYNWMAAVGAAIVVGVKKEQIEEGIRSLEAVRGRFERVGDASPTVIVDYAHKPDALEKLLRAVRDLAGGKRIVLLFGCGGDRDKGKRPEMGEIGARLADELVLTSDNPRSEDPKKILDEIAAGIGGKPFTTEPDRRVAIAKAIAKATDDDVIVIAGKGHETYQVVGDQVIHFDDREEAELALKKRAEK